MLAFACCSRLFRRFSILFMLMVAMALSSCKDATPVRIGLISGLTGNNADFGEAGRNGALLAVELRNKAGGVNGRPVELIVRDDGGSPDKAVAAFNELADLKVNAVIGGFVSASAKAMQPTATARKLVLISPTASSLSLADQDDYLFRLFSTTRDNAQVYAQRHVQKHGFKRVAMVYDVHNKLYTESWAVEYKAALKGLGGEIVTDISYDSSQPVNYENIVTQLLAHKPDMLLFISSSIEVARLAQLARKLNPDLPLAAAEWAGIDSLMELGGKAVNGMEFFLAVDRTDTSANYLSFRKTYSERFQTDLSFVSQASFEATNVLLEALARQSKSSADLKQTILQSKVFPGLQQDIQFNATGDALRRGVWTVTNNGEFNRIQP